MKSFMSMNLLVLVAALTAVLPVKGDGISSASVTLTFKKNLLKNTTNIEYLQYDFIIDTQIIKYHLLYKTFVGAEVKNNGLLTSDGTGYGMASPFQYWYQHGLLNVFIKSDGKSRNAMRNIEGVPTVLEKSGKRIAYDITFKKDSDCVVVRTVALGGKEELYIGVYCKSPSNGTMESQLLGYPFGFKVPRDRVVYSENLEIKNGDPKTDIKAQWLLLSDKLKEKDEGGGMLGVIYDKNTVSKVSVGIEGNYLVSTFLETPIKANEFMKQYCMIFTFGATTVADAKKMISSKAGISDKAFEEAFSGLPDPVMQ